MLIVDRQEFGDQFVLHFLAEYRLATFPFALPFCLALIIAFVSEFVFVLKLALVEESVLVGHFLVEDSIHVVHT